MARLNPREIAQKLALQGKVDSAMVELGALQQRGDISANASLAEIAAFKGQWDAVLKYARVVVETPSSVETMNVYVDMVNLLALAGIHLKNWSDLCRIADTGLTKLKPERLDEDEEGLGQGGAVRGLAKFSSSKGQENYVWDLASQNDEPIEKRASRFKSDLEELAKNKNKRFKTLQARRNHLFALARVRNYYQGAVALFDQEGPPDRFDSLIFAASGLARCGRLEDAWHTIQSKLHLWWPVEETQIAPVVLLTDEGIRPLMIRERCEEVLRTPRGPEAKVK